MRRAVGGILAGVVLVATGCGTRPSNAVDPSGGLRPSAKTLTVTLRQNGQTVTLHPGDELLVSLGVGETPAAPPAEAPSWTLRGYPKGVLRLNADPRNGQFSFIAVAAGTGKLRATAVTDTCGGGRLCPLAPGIASKLLTYELTVRVS